MVGKRVGTTGAERQARYRARQQERQQYAAQRLASLESERSAVQEERNREGARGMAARLWRCEYGTSALQCAPTTS